VLVCRARDVLAASRDRQHVGVVVVGHDTEELDAISRAADADADAGVPVVGDEAERALLGRGERRRRGV
jgi:hypothetical protein